MKSAESVTLEARNIRILLDIQRDSHKRLAHLKHMSIAKHSFNPVVLLLLRRLTTSHHCRLSAEGLRLLSVIPRVVVLVLIPSTPVIRIWFLYQRLYTTMSLRHVSCMFGPFCSFVCQFCCAKPCIRRFTNCFTCKIVFILHYVDCHKVELFTGMFIAVLRNVHLCQSPIFL